MKSLWVFRGFGVGKGGGGEMRGAGKESRAKQSRI